MQTTSENIEALGSHSSEVSLLVSAVAEASKEQSTGLGQISQAMQEMDQVTQTNATSAEQFAEEAGRLSDQAGQLLSAVEGLGQLMHGQTSSSPQLYTISQSK